MKSTITLTDEVNVETVEDLQGVNDTLADLITKAGNFAIDGKVDHLRVELKTEPESYRCEQEKHPGRTYAQLVVKVSSNG